MPSTDDFASEEKLRDLGDFKKFCMDKLNTAFDYKPSKYSTYKDTTPVELSAFNGCTTIAQVKAKAIEIAKYYDSSTLHNGSINVSTFTNELTGKISWLGSHEKGSQGNNSVASGTHVASQLSGETGYSATAMDATARGFLSNMSKGLSTYRAAVNDFNKKAEIYSQNPTAENLESARLAQEYRKGPAYAQFQNALNGLNKLHSTITLSQDIINQSAIIQNQVTNLQSSKRQNDAIINGALAAAEYGDESAAWSAAAFAAATSNGNTDTGGSESNGGNGNGGGNQQPAPALTEQEMADFTKKYNSWVAEAAGGNPDNLKAWMNFAQHPLPDDYYKPINGYIFVRGDGPKDKPVTELKGNGNAVFAVDKYGNMFHVTSAVYQQMVDAGQTPKVHDGSQTVIDIMGVDGVMTSPTVASLYEPTGWNEKEYLAKNPDVAAAVERGDIPSGLVHYYSSGKEEGRQSDFTPAGWNEKEYLKMYPDVAAAVERGDIPSGLSHYFSSGKAEGRKSDFTSTTSTSAPSPVVPPVGSTGGNSASTPTSDNGNNSNGSVALTTYTRNSNDSGFAYPWSAAQSTGTTDVMGTIGKAVAFMNEHEGKNYKYDNVKGTIQAEDGSFISKDDVQALNNIIVTYTKQDFKGVAVPASVTTQSTAASAAGGVQAQTEQMRTVGGTNAARVQDTNRLYGAPGDMTNGTMSSVIDPTKAAIPPLGGM